MKYVPKAVTRTVGMTVLRTKKNSPQLLFAAGLVGFAGTVVLACKATMKVEDVLTDHEKAMLDISRSQSRMSTDHDSAFDRERQKVLIGTSARIFKLYAPAVGVGAISVVCLTQSHRILTERNTQLTAAYVGLQKFLESYRGRVRKEVGEEREEGLYYAHTPVELAEDTPNGPKKVYGTIPGARSPYSAIFDDDNTNWQTAHDFNVHFIRIQQDRLTDKLRAQGSLMLNEVYDRLDLPRTSVGALDGWIIDPECPDYVDIKILPMRDFNGSLMLDFNASGNVYELLRGRASGRR